MCAVGRLISCVSRDFVCVHFCMCASESTLGQLVIVDLKNNADSAHDKPSTLTFEVIFFALFTPCDLVPHFSFPAFQSPRLKVKVIGKSAVCVGLQIDISA